MTLTSLTGTLLANVSPYVPPTASRQRSSATHLAESILTKVDYVTGRCRWSFVLSVGVRREVRRQSASDRRIRQHVGLRQGLLDDWRVRVR